MRAEIAEIVKIFPDLEMGSAVSPAVPAQSPIRRRRMSAAGRRAIAAAQRARWATIKKAAKPTGRKRKGMSPAARKAASERMKNYWKQKRKGGAK